MSITPEEVKTFTSQFLTIIDEGHSLVRSLSIAAEQQQNPDLRQVIKQVNDDIQADHTLSSAMAQHPDVFDQNYIATVKRGEQGGDLWDIMHELV